MSRRVNRGILFKIFVAAVIVLTGCNGGDDDSDQTADNYNGTWDVRYNLTVDDCQLVTPGIIGLVDQHIIEEGENGVTFVSADQLVNVDNGEIREDGSLFVNQAVPVDVFGDGTPCNLDTTITYANRVESSAETQISTKIICNGEQLCTSEAIGTAERQPS